MSVRRSKTMPTDGPTAKFLYTIIKQLDLKSIDWNLVASQLEISNGHAARMRFSRFKQQMEGITSTPRAAKPKKASKSIDGKGIGKVNLPKSITPPPEMPVPVKREAAEYDPGQSPYIKTDPYQHATPTFQDIPLAASPSPGGSAITPSSSPGMGGMMRPVYSQPPMSMPQRRPQPYLRQQNPQRRFPFSPSPFPQYSYPPTTVSPAELSTAAGSSPSFPMHMGYDMARPRPVWTPVKQVKREREDEGGYADLPVKTEGSQEQFR